MAEDVRLKYLNLIKVEKEARMRFVAMERMISEVATALSSYPFEFSFNNVGVSTPFRAPSNRTLDGRIWPSAEQVQSALVKWYTAREEAVKVWTHLPEADRQGLAPPTGHRA